MTIGKPLMIATPATIGKLACMFIALILAAGLLPASWQSALADQAALQEAKAPADSAGKEEVLLPVLSPEQFVGPAAMGYAAAKGCPHVCHHLFCYCGCDITDNHKCLLDCFTGTHGADCHICQEEAMVALRMSRNEEPLAAIQKKIDETYAGQYPFKEESPALKHYKAMRQWQPGRNTLSSVSGPAGNQDAGATCCGSKN